MKFILALILIALILPGNAFSQGTQPIDDAFSIGISPSTVKIDSERGAKPTVTFSLDNKSTNTVELIPSFSFFKASPKNNGEIEFRLDNNLTPDEKSLLTKLTISEADISTTKITLLPYESKLITLTIDLSNATGSGDFYFSTIFTSYPKDNSENESITQVTPGVAANIFLSIGDKGNISGSVIEYESPGILTQGPVPITLLVENLSNTSTIPSGQINIRNMFGQKISNLEINPGIMLSNSRRYMTNPQTDKLKKEVLEAQNKYKINTPVMIFNDNFLFGIYTADLKLKLSPTSAPIERSIRFIVIPPFLIISVSIVIFVSISIYVKARRKAN